MTNDQQGGNEKDHNVDDLIADFSLFVYELYKDSIV